MKNSSATRTALQSSKAVRSTKARKAEAAKSGKKVEILGPVDDLQSYVKADWWRDLFNANYLRTDGDVVDDESITAREADRFLKRLKPAQNARILDLCCGQGRHSLEFAKRGYAHVTGFDRSHYLVTRARAAAKAAGLPVTFREGDARKLPFSADSFDAVMIMGNSFGYFESEKDDELVLREVWRVLKPGGKILLDLTDGEYIKENYQPRSWEWIDRNYFVCRERSLSDDSERLVSREVITHTRKGVVSDQFYAERLYSPEQMTRLLATADCFGNIKSDCPFVTESSRNQDLGMMERRVVYTAVSLKKAATKKTRTAKPKSISVAVALGDPGKADVVKPNGSFDTDDFDTIAKLREALEDIPGYQFTYYDNHDTLITDAHRMRTDHSLVFNLCDEGFLNDARKELHVPALLEMLGIPYTGGTPQCLAYCYDKSLVRGIAREMDIPVPEAFVINPGDTTFHEITIPFPVILKPNFGDSSVGITRDCVCEDIVSLESAYIDMRERLGNSLPVVVEQFLTGKDISVGFIGNTVQEIQILPVIEEDYSSLPADLPKICGYEAKWDPESPYAGLRSIPANLPVETETFLTASCQRLFDRLECRDYARFDWRLDSYGTPRLLEVNPNPGWCWDGHLAKMAELASCDYREMLKRILDAAAMRVGLK